MNKQELPVNTLLLEWAATEPACLRTSIGVLAHRCPRRFVWLAASDLPVRIHEASAELNRDFDLALL